MPRSMVVLPRFAPVPSGESTFQANHTSLCASGSRLPPFEQSLFTLERLVTRGLGVKFGAVVTLSVQTTTKLDKPAYIKLRAPAVIMYGESRSQWDERGLFSE